MEKTKKLLAVLVIATMLIGCFSLVFSKQALANGETDGQEQQGAEGNNGEGAGQNDGEGDGQNAGEGDGQNDGQGGEPQGIVYTVDFGEAQWVIDGVTVTAVTEWEPVLNNGPIEMEDRDRIKLNNFNPDTMEIVISAADGFNAKLSLVSADETTLQSSDADGLPDNLTFSVVKKQAQPDEGGQPPVQGGPDDIEFDIQFTGTHALVSINDISVMDDADGNFKDSFKGVIEGAGQIEGTNKLKIENVFGDLPITNLKINGVSYKAGDQDVETTEAGFVVTVAGAAKYTITGEADETAAVARTIIWTNPNYVPTDAADEEWIQEFKLEHGYAYVIAVYDENGNLIPQANYASQNWVTNENGGGVGSDGFGWIMVQPDSRVIFEFVPEYGYQLTDIRINGQKLNVSRLMNQFEFIMPNTNIHFDAEFTKTKDVLKANSEKVKSGKISMGNNQLDGGSVQLTVNDVELSADKIEGFENAAGDYSISNYLDIDLYQVFYKGKNDSEDVWSNKIDELNNEVTITIKLADGVDGNDIVLVHNVHDGEKYEIIQIDSYDPETNTITFRTKSFSSYAIASKTSKEIEYTVPTEGFIAVFMDKEGYDFDLVVVDFSKLTDADLEQYDIPKDVYTEAYNQVKENTKKFGTFLGMYDITIMDVDKDYTHDGKITFKIKITDEMKKYNSFKLAQIDGDDYSVKNEIETKIEDGYIVATLPDVFDAVVLTGKVVENNSTNPQTGDMGAKITIVLAGACILYAIVARRRYIRKH